MLVFDHGPGTHHRLLEAGRKAVEVTDAFFTHLHYYHCLDYPRLVLQRWDTGAGRIPELNVVGPPPIARMTALLFVRTRSTGRTSARTEHEKSSFMCSGLAGGRHRLARRPDPQVREVQPGAVIERRGWTVRCRPRGARATRSSSASVPDRQRRGFALLCGRQRPSASCRARARLRRAPADEPPLQRHRAVRGVHRAACGNHEDNARMAQEAGVRVLVLTHLLAQIDQPGTREEIVQRIGRVFDGQVIWGAYDAHRRRCTHDRLDPNRACVSSRSLAEAHMA